MSGGGRTEDRSGDDEGGGSAPLSESTVRARNRQRIVDAAQRLWRDNPNASMDEVALHAGMARRTLYGHYASREELIVEVSAAATAFLEETARSAEESSADPAAHLAAAVLHLWTVGEQLRRAWASSTRPDGDDLSEIRRRIATAVMTIVASGQARGQFSTHLPAAALRDVLAAAATALHEASATDPLIDARHVAMTALLIVGVDRTRAHDTVTRLNVG